MTILPIYAALLALLFVLLGERTIRTRHRRGVALGHGDDPAMLRAFDLMRDAPTMPEPKRNEMAQEIWRLIAGWLTKSASAARETEPRRTVWQNARSGFNRSDL